MSDKAWHMTTSRKDGRVWPMALAGAVAMIPVGLIFLDLRWHEALGLGLALGFVGLVRRPANQYTQYVIDSDQVKSEQMGSYIGHSKPNVYELRSIQPESLKLSNFWFFGISRVSFRTRDGKSETFEVYGDENGRELYRQLLSRAGNSRSGR